MMAARTVRWRLPAGAELLWRSWDQESVVFNTLSGETHLLDGLSAAILEEIESVPGTSQDLVARVAARFGAEPDEGLSERVTSVCRRFDELGLTEAVAK